MVSKIKNYDSLKLENQLCFLLYACSREVVKQYHSNLEKLNLTYTQYIAMLVFWEMGKINARELGRKLHLDSGTLTPVLKSLESKGYIRRYRSSEDERILIAEITQEGENLKEKAVNIPEEISKCINLDSNEAMDLYKILSKILSRIK